MIEDTQPSRKCSATAQSGRATSASTTSVFLSTLSPFLWSMVSRAVYPRLNISEEAGSPEVIEACCLLLLLSALS